MSLWYINCQTLRRVLHRTLTCRNYEYWPVRGPAGSSEEPEKSRKFQFTWCLNNNNKKGYVFRFSSWNSFLFCMTSFIYNGPEMTPTGFIRPSTMTPFASLSLRTNFMVAAWFLDFPPGFGAANLSGCNWWRHHTSCHLIRKWCHRCQLDIVSIPDICVQYGQKTVWWYIYSVDPRHILVHNEHVLLTSRSAPLQRVSGYEHVKLTSESDDDESVLHDIRDILMSLWHSLFLTSHMIE